MLYKNEITTDYKNKITIIDSLKTVKLFSYLTD